MSTCTVGERSFFLQFPLKQLLICNAYFVFEYRLLKYYLLSEILPTSGLRKRNWTVPRNIGMEKQPKSIKDHSTEEGNQPRWR
jgi:hypothetical protein